VLRERACRGDCDKDEQRQVSHNSQFG
jgi:hypothetical protein